MRTISWQAWCWALAFLLALALSTLIPPMQSPDENSHIARAYAISQGDLLLQPSPQTTQGLTNPYAEVKAFIDRSRQQGGRLGAPVDNALLILIDRYMGLVTDAQQRLPEPEREKLAQLNWSNTTVYYPMPGTGYYLPVIYAPHAVGFAVGRWFGLSVQPSYFLARGATLLACFALLWWAWRVWTPNPLVLALLLLPMSVFQMLSPTIDGLTTALALLCMSLFWRLVDVKQPPSAALSWSLALCIGLLATSRTHLLPLLALPYYVAWQRHSRREAYLGGLVTLASLAWVLFALSSTNDPRVVRSHSTTALLMHYAADPMAFFKVVWTSVADEKIFHFYQQSFIGILGWLDTKLPEHFYAVLWVGLGLCGLACVSPIESRSDGRARLLLLGMALASTGLIFLALLVTWTPHPASVVLGVQGRYFIVPMMLLGCAATGLNVSTLGPRRWLSALVLTGFALTALTALTLTLVARYH